MNQAQISQLAERFSRQGDTVGAQAARACLAPAPKALPSALAKLLRLKLDATTAHAQVLALTRYGEQLLHARRFHEREAETLAAHSSFTAQKVLARYTEHRNTAATIALMEAAVAERQADAQARWNAAAAVLESTSKALADDLRNWGIYDEIG